MAATKANEEYLYFSRYYSRSLCKKSYLHVAVSPVLANCFPITFQVHVVHVLRDRDFKHFLQGCNVVYRYGSMGGLFMATAAGDGIY
jgi:hypothetical protein